VRVDVYRINLPKKALRFALLAGALLLPSVAWPQGAGRTRSIFSSSSPFSGGVAAQGRIVPSGGVLRIAAPTGASGQAIVDELLVKEGDMVEANQLLANLHGRALLQAQVDAALRDQNSASAALSEAQAAQAHAAAEIQVQITDLDGRTAIADANVKLAVSSSSLALEEAKQSESATVAAVETAKKLQQAAQAATTASVAVAQAQFDAIPKTRTAERAIATAQIDEAKAAKLRADAEAAAQVEELQSKADLAVVHTRQAEAALVTEPAAEASANLAPVQAEALAARASAAAARKLLETVQAERAADVAAAQARVDAAASALAVVRAQLALSEVRAPAAGKVLSILTHPGEAVNPIGLLLLGDTRDMYVDALVYIDDLAGVHVGQKTLTTGSALPDDGVTGLVVAITPMVAGNTLPNTDPTVFSDQPVVLVRVKLDNSDPAANLVNGQVKVQFAP
jgi:ABC exporter DevB family membrane fusion protein